MDANPEIAAEAPTKFVPLPRQLTESQLTAIRALPRHEESPTPTTEASRPARIYTDPARFESERRHILRAMPLPILPSCVLSQRGTFMANDAFGVPILLTRDREGKAHAFFNICTHRGSKLVVDCDVQKGGRVSCPYHAWTYDAEGKLTGLPRHDTFPSADKSKLGLTPMPCFEAAGYIWVGLDRTREYQLPPGTDALAADLQALGLPNMHLYGQRYYDLKSNWKLVIEPFLEAYHVKRLHAKTVAGLNADTLGVYEQMGVHSRQTAGKVHFTPENATDLTSDRLHKTITHSYHIFPTTIIVTSPYFISTMLLMPRAADRTVVQYNLLMPQPMRDAAAEDLFRRSYQFQDEIFKEDFGAGVLQQESLECGVLETVRFGGMETPIGPFHTLVESFLNGEAI